MIDRAVLQSLVAVGLTEKEARMFMALSALGEGTASAIAKAAGVKRSIAYFTLQRLVASGFAQEIDGHRVKRYAAVPVMRLLQHVQANVENLRMMIPLLNAMQHGRGKAPRIELFEGKDAILPVYRSMESARRSSYFTCWNRVQAVFPEEVQRWSASAANPRNPNKVKNLIVNDRAGQEMAKALAGNPKQEFRTIPAGAAYQMNIGIADDVVAMTSFDPLFVIMIHSKEIAEGASALFDLAWSAGKAVRV
ncbi:MAG: Sugar-specific transcriptional regulator TrmB [Candidatus Parcubacteria bacterium]|jgi:sugar-specific transcriptional regulator TrmB